MKNNTSLSQNVLNYLLEQCRMNHPATYAHFHKKYPEIIISKSNFKGIAGRYKYIFQVDPKKLNWYEKVRLNKDLISPDERPSYFPKNVPKTHLAGRVWQYLTTQCEKNQPATYFHFSSISMISISVKKFSDYEMSWKRSFKYNSRKMEWYEKIRLNRKIPQLIDKKQYFPETYEQKILKYLKNQCNQNLPATYAHFSKIPVDVSTTADVFKTIVSRGKKEFMTDPKNKYWFEKIRQGRKGLTPEQMKDFFPTKKTALRGQTLSSIRDYAMEQCSQNLPATYAHFTLTHPETKISPKEFSTRMRRLKKEFLCTPQKKDWFETIRENKKSLTTDQQKRFFPKRIITGCISNLVRDYLTIQCNSNLPATYLHFKNTYSDTRTSRGAFDATKQSWKEEHADCYQNMLWDHTTRLSKAGLNKEQIKLYFPKRVYIGSISEEIRKYLIQRCGDELSGSYSNFRELNEETSISPREFYNGISSLRKEFANTPQRALWFKEMFPARLITTQADLKTLFQFLDENQKKNLPTSREKFSIEHPECPPFVYTNGLKKWIQIHANDQEAIRWSKEVRIYEKQYISRVGHYLDRNIVSKLYQILKHSGIPLFIETTSFCTLGNHPRTGRLVTDKRIEGRLFINDLLENNFTIGSSLRNLMSTIKCPELCIDVTLSQAYSNKIRKYAESTSILLIITPGGLKGQKLLEPNVRVLSYSEFIGSKWFNLAKNECNDIQTLLDLARNAILQGATSQAFRELYSLAESQWKRIKTELKGCSSQNQYEKRIHTEIVQALRQGKMPRELEVYIYSAREAGHTDYADRLGLMARAMAALGAKLQEMNVIADVNLEGVHKEENKRDKNINQLRKLEGQQSSDLKVIENLKDTIGLNELDDNFYASVKKVTESAVRMREICRQFSENKEISPKHEPDVNRKRINEFPSKLQQERLENIALLIKKTAGEHKNPDDHELQGAKLAREREERIRAEGARDERECNTLDNSTIERNCSTEIHWREGSRTGQFRG